MPFEAKLRKIGNSQCVIIPFKIAKKYAQDGIITLKAIRKRGAKVITPIETESTQTEKVIMPVNVITEPIEDISIEPSDESRRAEEFKDSV